MRRRRWAMPCGRLGKARLMWPQLPPEPTPVSWCSLNCRRETLSMHAFELHAKSSLDGLPKCCHTPLTDAFAPRRYRLRLSERHLGDAVTGDDVAIRQQVAGGV